MTASLRIEEWDNSHARWNELWQFIEAQNQARWAEIQAEWHLSSHILVALQDEQIVGFLRFITQVIGVEEDHEPVTLNNISLTEAKILASIRRIEARGLGVRCKRSLSTQLSNMAAIRFARTVVEIRRPIIISNYRWGLASIR